MAFRSSSVFNSGGVTSTSVSLSKPAGTAAGDRLIAHIGIRAGGTCTPPADWSLVRNNGALFTYTKVATASEPASYTFTSDQSNYHCGAMLAYSGVSGVRTSAGASGTSSGSPSAYPAPSLTATAGDILLCAWFFDHGNAGDVAVDPAAGMTERADSASYAASVAADDEPRASAGDTGTRSASIPGSVSVAAAAHSLLLITNAPPNAPILTAPADASTIDRAATQRFDWDFSDPDPGDTQSAYNFRYRATGAAKNEIQTVTITGSPTGGSFTLTYDGQTTAAIPFDAVAAAVQTALEGLSNIGVGDVSCTGGPLPGAAVTVTFTGALGNTNVAQMTATSSLTGGTTPAVTVATTQEGAPLPAWTETGWVSTPSTYRDVAGGTFADATDYEWQVATKDAQGVEGPYSTSSFFTAANAPGGPTITAPVSGGTVEQFQTVEWSTPNQDAYQIQVLDGMSVTYDSGTVVSSTARSAVVEFPDNDVARTLQIRVEDGGLMSPWTAISVSVSYTPPPTPSLVAAASNADGAVSVTLTTPAAGVDEPTVEYVDLYVRDTTGQDKYRPAAGIRLAAQQLPNGVVIDWIAASGDNYEYQAVAVGDNGTTSASAWTAIDPDAVATVYYGGDY